MIRIARAFSITFVITICLLILPHNLRAADISYEGLLFSLPDEWRHGEDIQRSNYSFLEGPNTESDLRGYVRVFPILERSAMDWVREEYSLAQKKHQQISKPEKITFKGEEWLLLRFENDVAEKNARFRGEQYYLLNGNRMIEFFFLGNIMAFRIGGNQKIKNILSSVIYQRVRPEEAEIERRTTETMAYFREGRLDEGFRQFELMLEDFPESAQLHLNYATLLFNKAHGLFQLDSRRAEAVDLFGTVKFHLTKSVSLYGNSLKEKMKKSQAFFLLGEISQYVDENSAEAKDYYERAVEADPGNTAAQNSLAEGFS